MCVRLFAFACLVCVCDCLRLSSDVRVCVRVFACVCVYCAFVHICRRHRGSRMGVHVVRVCVRVCVCRSVSVCVCARV